MRRSDEVGKEKRRELREVVREELNRSGKKSS